ncbi:MAG: hypothetical protein K0S31_4622 [Sphingobacterium multivorum]|jgi:hypothetical protein|nr:hypothetical protein [Sphingobacterium multivorum]
MLKNLKSLLNRSSLYFGIILLQVNHKALQINRLITYYLYQERYNQKGLLIFGTK